MTLMPMPHYACPGPLVHTLHNKVTLASTITPLCSPISLCTHTQQLLGLGPPVKSLNLISAIRSWRWVARNQSTLDPLTTGETP